jgi:hypothetical protein
MSQTNVVIFRTGDHRRHVQIDGSQGSEIRTGVFARRGAVFC